LDAEIQTQNFFIGHVCKCFHLEENVCEKWKFEAILGKFIFECGSTDKTKWRPVVRKILKKVKKKVKTDLPYLSFYKKK
jgi:hypothetical protein